MTSLRVKLPAFSAPSVFTAAVFAAAACAGYMLWRGTVMPCPEADMGPSGLSGAVPRERFAATIGGMSLIPAGEFQMGSSEGEGQSEEHPLHPVYLGAYYIDEREVTVERYRRFAESTGRAMPGQEDWSTGSHPVVNVNWYDAKAYCEWAGGRLPTEAEWENAARGGRTSDFDLEKDRAELDGYSWNSVNSGNLPRPVGLKRPNAFGLYDMRGNVWEWVSDRLDRGYYGASPARDPQGPASGKYRVMRGGSVRYDGSYLRMAYRGSNFPCFRGWDIGFRCAASVSGAVPGPS